MTENMKKFLDAAEGDAALAEAIGNTETHEEMILLAKEKGIALTEADFEEELPAGELSDDDLDGVAGGIITLPLMGSYQKAGTKLFGGKTKNNQTTNKKAGNLLQVGGAKKAVSLLQQGSAPQAGNLLATDNATKLDGLLLSGGSLEPDDSHIV